MRNGRSSTSKSSAATTTATAPTGTDVAVAPGAAGNAILAGIEPKTWHSSGALYRSSPVDKAATILLTGTDKEGTKEPVAWTRLHNSSRVFYTSLGHRDDFAQPQFRRMLVNAVGWGLGKTLSERKAAP